MADLPEYIDPEVYEKVVECFADALGLDEDEIEHQARLVDDLGAESLDFLDIAFRLERAFDIKIPRGGVEETARLKAAAGDNPYEVDGVLTAHGLKSLADSMPEVPPEEFKEGLKAVEIPLLFRVSTFCRLVSGLLDAKAKGIEIPG